ncbi:hypothetical protein HOK31_17265, partial [Candidatus Poribacteria bacterium]|nr:hypothetical protein [Candidatus Poribacteria bacterium]
MNAAKSWRRLSLYCVAALFALSTVGARAQIEDFQSVSVSDTPPAQEVGPMFMALPAGFAIPLTLEITNRLDVEIDGQTATGAGTGGGVGASGMFTLEAGQTYAVTETYAMTATVDALFVRGKFPVSVVVPWEFTAPASGEYAYSSSGAVRQLTVSVGGDITGSTRADAV